MSGADVVYAARSPMRGQSVAQFVETDIHDENAIAKLFSVMDTNGDLDFVVNTAAINHFKTIEEIDTVEWDDVNEVNLFVSMRCNRRRRARAFETMFVSCRGI